MSTTMEENSNSIAIVGMSCRFPGANSPEEFWDVLYDGKDVTSEVPIDRHCAEQIKTHIKRGGFLKCPVDEMDAHFFNVPAKEASILDPQQRLLLEVTWEALEKAGINPLSLKGSKTGVYIGVWSNDYEKVLQNSSAPTSCEFHVAYLSIALGGTAARISYFLGCHGPHGSIDAGCASSLYSLHQACQSLRNGETNLAIAGGVNLILYPVIGKYSSMVFAPDGRCKTFDAKVDGYGRAEGCAALILKRLPDALKNGDKILAVIKGIAVNSDAASTTFGTPCKLAQTKAIRDALKDAKISPEKVTYVEVHGTGTEVGDEVEMAALASGYSHRNRKQPLIVGSVKTNMGHAEAAAGLAGLIKVVLSFENETIPAHINFKQLSPHVNLKAVPATIPLVREKWRTNGEVRMAGVSAFALGGQNAHVILEEAPKVFHDSNDNINDIQERPLQILTLSGKCEESLEDILKNYVDLLSTSENISLGDIAYSANATKAVFQHRVAVLGKDSAEMRENILENNFLISRGKISRQKSKVAFLFSDSRENLNFSQDFYDTNSNYKNSFDHCNTIYLNNSGKSLFGKNEGGENQLNLPLLFSIQYSLFKLWKSLGVAPDCVFGCGVGEFAAAAAAGILSLENSLRLLMALQNSLEDLPLVDSLTVRTSLNSAKVLLEQFPNLNIVTINSENEVLISGESSAIIKFADFCSTKGIHATENSFAVPDLYTIASKEKFETVFNEIICTLEFENCSCSFISGFSGKVLGESHFKYDEEYWIGIVTQSVNFSQSVKTLAAEGCRIFVEISSHPSLLGLAMSNLAQKDAHSSLWLPSLRKDENNWTTLLSSLGKLFISGASIKWENLDVKGKRTKVDLPTYPFQRQKFWIN